MTTSSGGGANSQAILEECREVGRALDLLDDQLSNLERVFRQVLARPDMPSDEINSTRSQVMTGYCALVNHVKNIKLKPESGSPKNAPQIGKEDRRLKAAIQRYQTLESEFRRDLQQAAERQYRIVRPKATDAEVREAVADTEAPIFKRAVCISHTHHVCFAGRLLIAIPALKLRLPWPSELHPTQREGASRGHTRHSAPSG
jgi:syntaxin 1B/2/3